MKSRLILSNPACRASLYGFGLLEQIDGWIRLTARGRLLGNEVFERFI